jgi:ribosome biogenesis GTPase
VAANIDTVFLVMGLDGDFNPRRMERLLVTAWESGAQPVVVLNKEDLCENPEEKRYQIEAIAPGAPVLTVSFLTGRAMPTLVSYINKGETIALIGSSGVGKSTLVNQLCGQELLRTREVRARDDRGRHATSHRQLVLLPGGGLLIDNPGIRELALWSTDGSLSDAFKDIHELAADCRFRDCRHESEPGCAVLRALEDGTLDAKRLESFRTLGKELHFLELRQDAAARRVENKKMAAIYKAAKKHKPRL